MSELRVLRDGSEIDPMTLDDLNAAIKDDKNYEALYTAEDAEKLDTLDIINKYFLKPMEDKNLEIRSIVPFAVKQVVNTIHNILGRGNTASVALPLEVWTRDALDTIVTRYMMSKEKAAPDDDINATPEKGDMSPMIVSTSYNTQTGALNPITHLPEDEDLAEIEKIYSETDINTMFDDLLNGNSDISEERFADVLGDSFMKDHGLAEFNDMAGFMQVLNSFIKGELKSDFYKALPESLQLEIKRSIPPVALTRKESNRILEGAAKTFLEDISKSYFERATDTTDLDNIIGSIYKAQEELSTGMKQVESSIHVVKFNNIMKLFKDRREKLVEAGEDEKVKIIDDVFLGPLTETLELNRFREFCKTVRIKKYDLERPDKVFRTFNTRYMNNNKNIYNIANCPAVLKDQLKGREDPETDAYKICLAFCKYAQNMSPENDADHTFMYYFIKNILVLNLIYPKGIKIDTEAITDESRKFYGKMVDSLLVCAQNLDRT